MKDAKTQILFTQGKDPSGSLIFANDAEKGLDYFCPLCNTEFILRKSGNTGKGSKRPHFAHKNLTVSCTPETVLHFLFKTQAYVLIKRHIEDNKPLNFNWYCKYCHEKHSGSLLKKAKRVELESNLGSCIPDIALFDESNQLFVVIEVVVTHAPEETALKYYKDNKVILIQIKLDDETDLERISSKLSQPDVVDLCLNPKCEKCGNYMYEKKLVIAVGKCLNCRNSIQVATIQSYSNRIIRNKSEILYPSDFNNFEIKLALEKGANILLHPSPYAPKSYFANSCNKCKSFNGDYLQYSEYKTTKNIRELPSVKHKIGYFCENCGFETNNI